MATQFQTQDADSQTFDLPDGQPFQTFWEMQDGQRVAEVISHPWNALEAYTADDLARFCITSTTIPDPPAPRADLPKSTVTERIIGLGKIGEVMGVLRSDDALYALWFAPDWQTVYKDDERVLPILEAAGLTTAEVAQVMA